MEIHGDRGARLDFSAYGAGVGELAWIVESCLMQRELWETVKRQPKLTLFCPAQPQSLQFDTDAARLTLSGGQQITAKLVVAADGVNSWVRQQADIAAQVTPYDEMGVVANFGCQRPHHNKAFQWILGGSVLAYLPLAGDAVSIVWSAPDNDARTLVDMTPGGFKRARGGGEPASPGRLHMLTPVAASPCA